MMKLDDLRSYSSTPCIVHDLHDGSCLAHDVVRDRVRIISRTAAVCLAALHEARRRAPRSVRQRVQLAMTLLREAFRGEETAASGALADAHYGIATLQTMFEEEWIVRERMLLERPVSAR